MKAASALGRPGVGRRDRIRELEGRIADLRAASKAASERTRQFCHDFNDALQAIILDAEQFEESDFPGAQDIADRILRSASRASAIGREVLSLATAADAEELSVESPTVPRAVQAPDEQARDKQALGASAQILVVEDEEAIRSFARATLEKAGYNVAVASNGVEAVEAVRNGDFSLILMDVQMPVMDGLTATRKIRQLGGPHSKTPIITLSGNVPADRIEWAGASDCLGKPFKPTALLQKVEHWFDRVGKTTPISPSPQPDGKLQLDDVCSLMGRPWVESALAKLVTQIDSTFGMKRQSTQRLARQAHALVSLAGVLGFATLAQLSSALEEACRSGSDVTATFAQARTSGMSARKAAIALIADFQR